MNTKSAKPLITIILVFIQLTLAQAKVYHVKQGGNGDGSSWQKASSDLQAMIDASSSGDEIWIASGTYKAQRLIKEGKPTTRSFILKKRSFALWRF